MNNRLRFIVVFICTLLTSIVCLASLLWVKRHAPYLYPLYSLQITILPGLAYLLFGIPEYIVSLSGTLKLHRSFANSIQFTFLISFFVAVLLFIVFSLMPSGSPVLKYSILDAAILVLPLNILFVFRSYVEANESLIVAQLLRSVYAFACYVSPVFALILFNGHVNFLSPTSSRVLFLFLCVSVLLIGKLDFYSKSNINLSTLAQGFCLGNILKQSSQGFLLNCVWIAYTLQVILIKSVVIGFGRSNASSLLFAFDFCLRASIVYGTLGVYVFPLLSRAINSFDNVSGRPLYAVFSRLLFKSLYAYLFLILPFVIAGLVFFLISPDSVIHFSGVRISGSGVFAFSLCVLFGGLRSLVLRPLFLAGASFAILLTSLADVALSLVLVYIVLHVEFLNSYYPFEAFFMMMALSSGIFFALDLWLASRRVTSPFFSSG